MITTDHVKELTHITYDRNALEAFYHSIKHKAKDYIEIHTDDIDPDSPYVRCICPKCLQIGKHEHSGNKHQFIRHLERFNNPEVNRLTSLLTPYIKSDQNNYPVLWIYNPGFSLPPHKDVTRSCSIMVPILPAAGGATVHLYNDDLPVIQTKTYKTVEHNDQYLLGVHRYSTKHPTVLNASKVIHGVQPVSDLRVFINFSGYCEWDSI